MLAINKISKIGIDIWGISGFAERNIDNDDKKQIKDLSYSFDQRVKSKFRRNQKYLA